MTTDSQKPTRQPQARKASSDRVTERTSSTTVASRLPSGTPACGKLPQKARLLFGLCSVTSSTAPPPRSEEHTSELQSLMRISYAVFCLQKKNKLNITLTQTSTS